MKYTLILTALLFGHVGIVGTANAKPCSTNGAKDGCYGTKGPLSNYRVKPAKPKPAVTKPKTSVVR
jgi:hypothetical protein